MDKILIFLFCTFNFISIQSVIAQSNFWVETNKPDRGYVTTIVVNSNDHIFVGTHWEGLYRSTNNGVSWTEIGNDLPRRFHVVFGIDRNDIIYARIAAGVIRSLDNGDTWTFVEDLTDKFISEFAFNSENHIFASTFQGVFRSTDDGNTWILRNFTQDIVNTLAINFKGHIFAGTDSSIYRSTDNGDNWDLLPGSPGARKLIINSEGHIFTRSIQGIFRSTDNGESWKEVNSGLTDNNIRALAVNSEGHLFAGTQLGGKIFQSTDNGDSWSELNIELFIPGVTVLLFTVNDELLVGTFGGGVLRSVENSNSYEYIGLPINFSGWSTLASDDFGNIYTGTMEEWGSGGLYRSTNNGESWTLIGLPNPNRTGLLTSGFLKVTDITEPYDILIHEQNITAIFVNKSGHIFAASTGGQRYWGVGPHLYRSTDVGITWTLIETISGDSVAGVSSFVVNSEGHIFAGSFERIYRSTDSGDTWTEISSGLTSVNVRTLGINADDYIFAGADNGVFYSTDNGENWTLLTGSPACRKLAINNNGHIFALELRSGVYRSTDDGNTWNHLTLSQKYFYALVIDSDGNIFVGTDGGVFRSSDNGESWEELNGGLTNTSVFTLEIKPDGYIFAGTRNGVFRSEQPTTTVRVLSGGIPDYFVLKQNYPNPFNPSTVIGFRLPPVPSGVGGWVTLKIYNVLGEKVATLVNEEKRPGSYEVTWDATGFASGVYFYRLTAGSFFKTKKMMLLR